MIARRSLDFMVKELLTPAGAFMASLSAVDDAHIEGGYYLWDENQLTALLGSRERRVYRLAWGMIEAAPFDSGYLPVKAMEPAEIAKEMELSTSEVEKLLASAVHKLYAARSQRGLPKDTKLLAGWNGLALSAFAYAARVTGNSGDRQVARSVRDYLMQELWDDGSLHRAVSGGRVLGRAAVEDYAYVAQGLLSWAEATGQERDFMFARRVALAAWTRFYRSRGWRLAEASLIQAEAAEI